MKELYDYFEGKKVNKVLDVGTGTGDFIPVLKKAFPQAVITGTDINPDSLLKASEEYPDLTFTEMGAEKLDFEDNTFDAAAISMALHHLSDVHQSLTQMQRVVKPGGWIIVSELFSDNLSPAQEVHKLFHHFRSYIDRLRGVTHNETFKKAEIIELVKESGIRIVSDFEFNPDKNLLEEPGQLEMWLDQMHKMLNTVRDYPQYAELQPVVEEFRKKALENGFRPATRVVVIGRVNSE